MQRIGEGKNFNKLTQVNHWSKNISSILYFVLEWKLKFTLLVSLNTFLGKVQQEFKEIALSSKTN